MTLSTADVIHRYNLAFLQHDPDLLVGLIADDCVMEAVQPAPDGERVVGGDACLRFWQTLAADRSTQFETEDVQVAGDRATIRWRYRFGPGPRDAVRGVNLMLVRDGLIVEALGYSKTTGEIPLATEVDGA